MLTTFGKINELQEKLDSNDLKWNTRKIGLYWFKMNYKKNWTPLIGSVFVQLKP
jgi:hypothetical protein